MRDLFLPGNDLKFVFNPHSLYRVIRYGMSTYHYPDKYLVEPEDKQVATTCHHIMQEIGIKNIEKSKDETDGDWQSKILNAAKNISLSGFLESNMLSDYEKYKMLNYLKLNNNEIEKNLYSCASLDLDQSVSGANNGTSTYDRLVNTVKEMPTVENLQKYLLAATEDLSANNFKEFKEIIDSDENNYDPETMLNHSAYRLIEDLKSECLDLYPQGNRQILDEIYKLMENIPLILTEKKDVPKVFCDEEIKQPEHVKDCLEQINCTLI